MNPRARPRSRAPGQRRTALAAIMVLIWPIVLGACSTTTSGRGTRSDRVPGGFASATNARSSPASPSAGTSQSPSSSPSSSPSGGPSVGTSACPAVRAVPDPQRPRIRLAFDLAEDHASVTGTETLDFTPDLDITELVFRLTANTALTYASGNSITVSSATADQGGQAARYERDGAAASSQGGLLRIPLARTVTAGTTVHAALIFRLALGTESFDRFGRTADFAWFASAQPLLAWENGHGWHDEPMIQFAGESATSEAADIDLTVTAPARDTVLMSGDPTDPISVGNGRRSWHAESAAARDVSVAAGPFVLQDTVVRETGVQHARVGRVEVRVGAPAAPAAATVTADVSFAISQLSARFGEFPFPSLSVALLPVPGGGIEYPGSILLLGSDRRVTVHETAHQWFYAMVGDSQAQHAWLDEAFASYAEQLVDADEPPTADLALPDPVDKPTASYGTDAQAYYATTYDKGAAALHAARRAAGPARFDAAVLCYVKRMAWKIAEPDDFKAALIQLPAALTVLTKAGALT